VASFDGEVLDVGLARFADAETVQAEQHGKRLVGEVVVVGGGEEHAKLCAVQATSVGGVNLGATEVLGGVRADPAVDVREAVEAAHRREPPVDRRRSEPSLLQRASPQLDVRAGRRKHGNVVVGGPLEEASQVLAVGLEGAAAVARQERRGSELRFVERRIVERRLHRRVGGSDRGHG
jgi:hypothetical protein